MFRTNFITGDTEEKAAFCVTRTSLQNLNPCLKRFTITMNLLNNKKNLL